MPARVTVIACLHDPADQLRSLAGSLDRQTLPYRDFDAVLIDLGSTDGSVERLRRLEARRPNVHVVAAEAGTDPLQAVSDVAREVETDYLLLLPPGDQLLPQALERLTALADSTNAELVLGRRVTASRGSGALLAADPARTTTPGPLGEDLVAAAVGAGVLARRDVFTAALTAAAPETAPTSVLTQLLADTTSAVILAGYGCLRGPGPLVREQQADELLSVLTRAGVSEERTEAGRVALTTSGTRPGVSVRLSAPGLSWEDQTLRLVLNGVIELPEDDPIELVPVVVLVDPRNNEEFSLPTSGSCTPSSEAGVLSLTARTELTPAVAALGSPLLDGPWQVKLRLFGAHLDVSVFVPAGAPAPAMLDGHPISVGAAGGGLRFDLGALTIGLVGPLQATQCRVTDRGTGNQLVVDLPGLHVRGDGRVAGHLLQNAIPAPGVVIAEDGRARLECFVGALGGRYRLSARFGGSGPQQTGLDLDVSGVGTIGIVEHRDPEPRAAEPATDQAPTASKPAAAAPKSTVQRLRRAVPASLEPAARKLSKVPAARWAYGRLIER